MARPSFGSATRRPGWRSQRQLNASASSARETWPNQESRSRDSEYRRSMMQTSEDAVQQSRTRRRAHPPSDTARSRATVNQSLNSSAS